MSVPAHAMTTDAGMLLDGCVDAEAAFRARWSCQLADDESPPSLTALPEQLDALRLVQQPAGGRVTQSKKKGSSAQEKVSGGVRRGFFDQPSHGGRKTSTAATQPPSVRLSTYSPLQELTRPLAFFTLLAELVRLAGHQEDTSCARKPQGTRLLSAPHATCVRISACNSWPNAAQLSGATAAG
jgi:hypothetical protein